MLTNTSHDSLRSVSVIAGVLGRAGERGQARRKADAAKGVCTWRNSPDIERWMEAENGKARTKAQGGAVGGGDGSRSIF